MRPVLPAAIAAGLALLAAKAPTPSGPSFYAVSTSAQMKVVVDVDAQKQADGTVGLPMFLFYAQPIGGYDIYADYFVFDCAAGRARLAKTVGVSKYVEPLDLKDTGNAAYTPEPGSMVAGVMRVACHGRTAIPANWRPLGENLRQISADYYRGYLGQPF